MYYNITIVCKKYNKLPGHFLDNRHIQKLGELNQDTFQEPWVKITTGRKGATLLNNRMMGMFIEWLKRSQPDLENKTEEDLIKEWYENKS